ncbi:MAG: hypothetical protein ACPGSI_10525 [Pikeienuella sp.]
MRKLDYSVAGFVLAFVLSPIIETSFRRALLLAAGDWTVFITRPVSLVLVVLMAAMLAFTLFKVIRARRAPAPAPEA